MLPDMKLVISQNDKIIQAVTKQVDTNNFVKAIEALQEVVNATLTNMIDGLDGSGDCIVDDEEDESDPDEEVCASYMNKKK